jgi:hypothetical protein
MLLNSLYQINLGLESDFVFLLITYYRQTSKQLDHYH